MYVPSPQIRDQIDRTFTYHAPAGNQVERYQAVRDQARALGQTLATSAPPSRELSLALTKLQEVVMFTNAAIATEEWDGQTLRTPPPPAQRPESSGEFTDDFRRAFESVGERFEQSERRITQLQETTLEQKEELTALRRAHQDELAALQQELTALRAAAASPAAPAVPAT